MSITLGSISITTSNHSTPFVLGTSFPPVRSIASRIAKARALNADSALIRPLVHNISSRRSYSLTCGGRSPHAAHPHATSPPLQQRMSERHAESSPSTALLSSPVSVANPSRNTAGQKYRSLRVRAPAENTHRQLNTPKRLCWGNYAYLVKRSVSSTISADTSHFTERLFESCAQCQCAVLCSIPGCLLHRA